MDIDDLAADPLAQITVWLDEAFAAGIVEAHAMSLATAPVEGRPSVRTVLLKGVDTGLVFFTNYKSRKAQELRWGTGAAVSLTWPTMGRQIRATGSVKKTSAAESDEYFATRPRGSQLAAWASPQSKVVKDRAELDRLYAEAEARFAGQDVPLPPHWGGYRLTPDEIEFWSRRDNRMHDRLRYRRRATGWRVDRLGP
jgi:pyridoxamine 5'-phosphate oxidase